MRRTLGLGMVVLGGCVHVDTPTDDTDTDVVADSDTDVLDSDTDPGDTEVARDTDTDAPDPCLAGGPVLRLGTGMLEYEAIVPGGDVSMNHGPQGGWHVNVSFQADHVPQFVILEWRLFVTETGQVITSEDPFQHRVALVPRGEGSWACLGDYPGERAYLDFGRLDADTDPVVTSTWADLCGVGVTLQGAVRLPGELGAIGDVVATASVDFRLQPDPYDGPPCEPTASP